MGLVVAHLIDQIDGWFALTGGRLAASGRIVVGRAGQHDRIARSRPGGKARPAAGLLRQLHPGRPSLGRVDRLAAGSRAVYHGAARVGFPARRELRGQDARCASGRQPDGPSRCCQRATLPPNTGPTSGPRRSCTTPTVASGCCLCESRRASCRGYPAAVVYIDLVGVDRATARRRLLEGVRLGRRRPEQQPSFPGGPGLRVNERVAPRFPDHLPVRAPAAGLRRHLHRDRRHAHHPADARDPTLHRPPHPAAAGDRQWPAGGRDRAGPARPSPGQGHLLTGVGHLPRAARRIAGRSSPCWLQPQRTTAQGQPTTT